MASAETFLSSEDSDAPNETSASKHTFEMDVHFLSQPRVDPVGGGIFGNGVFLYPPATGECVEVVAGANGLVNFIENGPGWKEAT